ncbi:MAG TPA: hypothetical protein VE967_11515 [Gemmatimonadaceae bacterium]|nr:hypothetical protein [Gemmatimonadaceae bacterium]
MSRQISAMRFKHSGAMLALAAVAVSPPQDRLPQGWTVTDQQYAYKVSLDTVAHGGASSGHIVATGTDANVSMFVSQAIKADDFRGKRVRFSAWIRARNAGTAATRGGVIFLRAEGGGVALNSYSTGNRPVGGSSDWTRRQIVLDIPPATIGLTFGFGMGGPGEIWIDDAVLEAAEADAPVSRPLGKAPVAERGKAALQSKLYAAAPKDPVNMDFEKAK